MVELRVKGGTMDNRACFIGLGQMGNPMASNLLKNGVKLFVYNRTKEKAKNLLQAGAEWLESPRDAFKKANIVFTMVSNDHALAEVTEGPDGLLENAQPGCIHVSMSTILPAFSRTLAEKHKEKGIEYVVATVFGRPDVAAKQALWVCLAGSKDAKQQVTPYLQFMGKKIKDFGEEPSIANSVKITGNFMIMSCIELMAEAYAFAEKSGIPLETLHSFFSEGMFTSPVMQTYGNLIINQNFTPAGFKMTLGLKDLDLFLRTADSLRVPSPIAGILHDRYMTALANNREEMDWSAISITAMEEAGLLYSLTT